MGGKGGEADVAARVEAVDGVHQTEDALLHQVAGVDLGGQSAGDPLDHALDQPEVGLEQHVTGGLALVDAVLGPGGLDGGLVVLGGSGVGGGPGGGVVGDSHGDSLIERTKFKR